MKKIFVLGLTALILSLSFISCDSDGGGGSVNVPVPSEYRGTYTHPSGDYFVVGANSVTVTLVTSNNDTFTLQYDPSVNGGNGFFGEFGGDNRLSIDVVSPYISLSIIRNGELVYSVQDTSWIKQ